MGPMMGGGAPGMGGLPPGVNPQQLAMMQALQQQQGMGRPPGFAKGGSVAVEDEEGDSPRAKKGKDREWGDVGKAAEDLPPVEAKAKGGKVKKHAPFGKGAPPKKKPTPPVPMVTDEDMDAPPPVQAAPPPVAPPAAGPAGPPPGPPPPGMNKGGKCDMGDKMMAKGGGVEQKGKTDCENVKMAAGGVAKVRHGFPNTNKKPKRMAKGGTVRGCGAAQKGKGFSGVY